ncbi:unnamed protein product [Caretta caretta]
MSTANGHPGFDYRVWVGHAPDTWISSQGVKLQPEPGRDLHLHRSYELPPFRVAWPQTVLAVRSSNEPGTRLRAAAEHALQNTVMRKVN